jgi:hypothetical protein
MGIGGLAFLGFVEVLDIFDEGTLTNYVLLHFLVLCHGSGKMVAQLLQVVGPLFPGEAEKRKEHP